jgi:hypothetical protein
MYAGKTLRAVNKIGVAVAMFTLTLAASCASAKKPVATALVDPPPKLTVQHVSQHILNNSAFIVEPGKYKSFKVEVTNAMTKPVVQGTFTAEGGNNDVEVYVLEENQLLNWQNNHKSDTTYSSGRVTAGKLKIPLPQEPGTYYVIFSNRFSYITNKAITADVWLEYDHQG